MISESRPHTDRIRQILFSPDRTRMVIASYDRKVSIWDLNTFEIVTMLSDHESEVSSVAFSHDGRHLVTAESDVYLHVRDAATGARLHAIRMPEGARWPTVFFSPDDRAIITSSHDQVVRTWHATSGALLGAVDVMPFGKLMEIAMHPNGREIAASGSAGTVSIWAIDHDFGFRILEHPQGREETLNPSIYTLDGSKILTAGSKGTVTVWDAESGALASTFRVPGEAYSIAADRDGAHALVSGRLKAFFPPGIWDTRTGKRLADVTGHTATIKNVNTSADGRTFGTASYDGSIGYFDTATGASRGKLQLGNERLPAIAFHPDGAEVAVTTENGDLLLVDRASGQVKRRVHAHDTWIQDVEYDRDGTRIVTAGRQEHRARVWNAKTGELELTLEGHKDNMMRASFSVDGRFIATSSMDHTARIWDAKTGAHLRTIVGPSYTAVFSPDGKELLTTGYNGYAVIWDMAVDERSAEELAAFVRDVSPWTLVDGRLVLERPAREP